MDYLAHSSKAVPNQMTWPRHLVVVAGVCAEFAGAVEHDDHESADENGPGHYKGGLGDRSLLGGGFVMVVDLAIATIAALIGAMRCC